MPLANLARATRRTAAWLLLLPAAAAQAPGAIPPRPEPERLVGTWHSRTSSSEGTLTILGDGTFRYRPDSEPQTFIGRWRLERGAIAWSYAPAPGLRLDPRAQPDVNAIVALSPDRFVLREADGTSSVFTRLQPVSKPAVTMPGWIERLWAAGVVAALAAFAFLAWRLLRPRSSTPARRRIYPCLKETSWATLGPTVRRPLARVEGAQWMPWVALGYDRPDAFVFLQEDELEEHGRSTAGLEAEALANLRDREASWQMAEIGLKGGVRIQMVSCTDDFFAAERILEPESILEAQRRLGASGLLAAVPRRGLLALVDADSGPEAIAWFVVRVAEEHFGGESAPISPMVFRMSGGTIVGALPSPPRPAAASGPAR